MSHVFPPTHHASLASQPEVWSGELSALASASLPEFLLTQRWYPAKDAGRPAVELSTLLPFPVTGIPAAVALWRITPPGLEPFLLFVPLALVAAEEADPAQAIAALPTTDDRGREPRLVEASSVDAFVRAWVEALLRSDIERSVAGGQLRTGQTPQLSRAGLEPGGAWAIRRSSAEQSNTSIRIGDGAILKVIRKLETGIHPELEVSRFLTGSAGFAATPAL
ncbi:MAG: 4-alpha-glucanotransferase, partial [Alphaproteobacteria bacterium]|nr:4-alpha-glucanotransferase [Alphaproteobacteria bacterium]